MLLNVLPIIQNQIIEYLSLDDIKNLSATSCKYRQLLRPLVIYKVRIPLQYLCNSFIKSFKTGRKIKRLKDTKVLAINCVQISKIAFNSVCKLTCLKELNLSGSRIASWNLPKLFLCLSNLVSLNLSSTDISDTTLCNVQYLLAVEQLYLTWTGISDAGLSIISTITTLKTLALGNCFNITDTGVAHLSNLVNLEELDLSYSDECEITDQSMYSISNLAGLKKLNISRCKRVTDNGLSYIGKLVMLEWLNISSCWQISDDGLFHLSSLVFLKYIDLSDLSRIRAKGVSIIEGLPSLRSFDCRFNCQL